MPFDVKRLDIYRKVPKDLTQPTYSGAFVSVGCIIFISLLLISELSRFLSVQITSELFVDDPGKYVAKIPVFLNVTLPGLPCEYVGLDIQDDMGRHEVGHMEDTQKHPVGENGAGCRYESQFSINKVPGNFHLSTHSAQQQPANPDMRHIIHDVKFGTDMQHRSRHGSFNPLKERHLVETNALSTHEYIVKIVPSVYEELNGQLTFSYQYTYAHKEFVAYHHTGRILPAIWFKYDLSPITVKYTERRQPLYSFLTTICAIVGGTFTVAGIIDSLVFTASEFYKKFELGKLS